MPVTFDEPKMDYSFQGHEPRGMIALVMKYSGGKVGERGASYILLGFAIIVLVISIFIFVSSRGTTPNSSPIISDAPVAGLEDPNYFK